MKEIIGDLWDFLGEHIICVTTNGVVKANGENVMGRGCALECKNRYPEIPRLLGSLLRQGGNHVYHLTHNIVSFPTKNDWRDPSDTKLIERSAQELAALADKEGWASVIVPRPGCNNGRLSWTTVRPVIERHLDDRFSIISRA